jgi:hypothetical protein
MRKVKDYWYKKRNLKTFNEQWNNLLNNVILPAVQRVINQDIVSIQPMAAPNELPIHYQNGVTEEKNFPFWRIKVIFKNKIK